MNYDKTKYKIWTWKSPVMLHWIINPGCIVGDLLGLRQPKVMLIERNSSKSLVERTLIPCPHCQTLHSGLKWSKQNETGFKNWFGLYCDNCGEIIPCIANLISYILLGLTFPIWIWFKDKWKAKWLEKQRVKFSKPLDLTMKKFKYQWWREGLIWGIFMYVFMVIVFPLIQGKDITQKGLLIGIPVWMICGLLSGLTMKWIYRKQKLTETELT
jgi:hypothetical protein